MSEITPDELGDRLAAENDAVFVLDIRSEAEYEDWHIPGSENISVYDELKEKPESADEALSAVPPDAEVVTVCAAGVISRTATDRLRKMGYDAKTLVDGTDGWSRVHRSAPIEIGIDGTLVQVARPGTGCLSHVLVSDGEAAVFDPSQYLSAYDAVLSAYDANLVGVFDTHAHADHVSGGQRLADRHDVPYYLHPEDARQRDAAPVRDEQTFEIGESSIEVIHTPGHSPGSVTFAIENEALLTGDTLFHESVGRVELGVEAGVERVTVAENAVSLYKSLQRLRERDGDPLVLPAHDQGTPEPPVTARLRDVAQHTDVLHHDRCDFVEKLTTDVPDHPPNFQQIKRVNIGAAKLGDEDLAALESGPNRCAAE